MSHGLIVLMACGSFSPPTLMHLRMFEMARNHFHTMGLGSIVGGLISPVHDAYAKKDLVSAKDRLAMLKLALGPNNWVKISDWETQQTGWTRTRVTLQHHQNTINEHLSNNSDTTEAPSWLPDDIANNSLDEPDNLVEIMNGNKPNVTVKLLCGGDLLESFAKPGLWSDEDIETIVGRHGLVVVARAGSDPARFVYDSDVLYQYRRNIIIITDPFVSAVSSTGIRRLLRRGESARYLTPDPVLEYVKMRGLYGCNTEYETYRLRHGKRSPQDVPMTSPEETTCKNILITIKDKPSIVGEMVTTKRPRKSNFLMPNHTDFVSPVETIKPKLGFVDKSATYVPGKAVKIVTDKDTVSNEYNSLDSYLKRDDVDGDVFRRRVSEGNVGNEVVVESQMKKRCSSTIRKLNPDDMKKSKSEVSKLCDKVKSMKLKEKDSGRNFKTRSCNDIVRLILTKHGIHVISDTEAIV